MSENYKVYDLDSFEEKDKMKEVVGKRVVKEWEKWNA